MLPVLDSAPPLPAVFPASWDEHDHNTNRSAYTTEETTKNFFTQFLPLLKILFEFSFPIHYGDFLINRLIARIIISSIDTESFQTRTISAITWVKFDPSWRISILSYKRNSTIRRGWTTEIAYGIPFQTAVKQGKEYAQPFFIGNMQRPSIVENFDLCYLLPADTEDTIRISPKRVAYQIPGRQPQYKDEKPPADALFIVFLRRDSGFLLLFPCGESDRLICSAYKSFMRSPAFSPAIPQKISPERQTNSIFSINDPWESPSFPYITYKFLYF